MEQLTKADLFNADWPKPVRVGLPDLGKEVYVRILAAGEVEAASKELASEEGIPGGYVGRVVALCACDARGVRLFTDDDARELARKPVTLLQPIFLAAQKANRMTGESQEEDRKNSSPAPA